MYDAFAEECLSKLPELEGTDWKECRRKLSRVYFALMHLRLNKTALAESKEAVADSLDYLHRLANAVEQQIFYINEYPDMGDLDDSRALAFIVAEAISLWCELSHEVMELEAPLDEEVEGPNNPKFDTTFAMVESALLYLASDYPINACCVIRKVDSKPFLDWYESEKAESAVVAYTQDALTAMCLGSLSTLPEKPGLPLDQISKIARARIVALRELGDIVVQYCHWLKGGDGVIDSVGRLTHLEELLVVNPKSGASGQYADILHLSRLVHLAIKSSSKLSLAHILPRPAFPDGGESAYEGYIRKRATSRPYLWPAAKKYIEDSFPGPHQDAVVVIPTGSGKSFLAELACSQAMLSGWVLYLAPTNALVNQIIRDLKSAFNDFSDVKVMSFVGGDEYTTLEGERLVAPTRRTIAVMTPEKCAMALRLSPEAFSNCTMCIADEFHLINDKHRGITLDLCLAQVTNLAPDAKLLLMSAMVSNQDDVTSWLSSLRGGNVVSSLGQKWRPSRSLRSLLFVDRQKSEQAYNIAKTRLLKTLSQKQKTTTFDATLGLLGGMLWQWDKGGDGNDYVSVPTSTVFNAKANRSDNPMLEGGSDWAGWKNQAAREFATDVWNGGQSVLCFVLTSKHHVFSCAEKTGKGIVPELDSKANSLIALAESELGVESRPGTLLQKGIGVHSSALLDSEQAAVEHCYSQRLISLLYATPTLAQGLNLPADVVVVAGSSLGDSRQQKMLTPREVDRENAVILNAFGRAGRAMVANHGMAVLVSDKPFFGVISESVNPDSVVKKYGLFEQRDGVVVAESPICEFLSGVTDIITGEFTQEELDLISQLYGDAQGAQRTLQRTYGAFFAKKNSPGLSIEAAVGRISEVGHELIDEHEMPDWLPEASIKSGMDLLKCWRLWKCVNSTLAQETRIGEGLQEALSFLIKVLRKMPPADIRSLLPEVVRKMDTVLDRMLRAIDGLEYERSISWGVPDNWDNLWEEFSELIWDYMCGSTYAELGAQLLSKEITTIDGRRSQGNSPIPAVFSFVSNISYILPIYAGALLVLLEASGNDVSDDLGILSLCMRNGCNDRSSLSWFRFGYRNRMAAHAFSKRYPVPTHLTSDQEVKKWVDAKFSLWTVLFDPNLEVDESQAFAAVRNLI